MCPYCFASGYETIKCGFYSVNTGKDRRIQRYFCKECRRKFSEQTGTLTFREHKPHLTPVVGLMLKQGFSQRACAQSLSITQATVARKLSRLTTEYGSLTSIRRFDSLPI